MKRVRVSFFISLAVLFTANSAIFSAPPQYMLTDLGPGAAYGVNNNGQVVGYSGSGAVLFDNSGQGNNITLGGVVAYSINDSGQAVGITPYYPYFSYAMNYKRNSDGTYTAEVMGNGVAWSVNNSGQMVGQSQSNAAIFTYNESLHQYQTTSLGAGYAYSNNDNGQIVGKFGDSFMARAALWNPNGSGGYTGTGLGKLIGYASSEAKSVNNNGKIVGDVYLINLEYQSYLYRAVLFDETGGGQNVDLGSLSGYTTSWANSINDSGQIVGTCSNFQQSTGGRATLFDITGAGNNIDLNTTLVNPLSGWTLREAYSINENGWIVGYMTKYYAGDHAFLLTLLPNPPPLF